MEEDKSNRIMNGENYIPEVVKKIKTENNDYEENTSSHNNKHVQILDFLNLTQLKTESTDVCEPDCQIQIYGEELTSEDQLRLLAPYSSTDYGEHSKNAEEFQSQNILKNMLQSNKPHTGKKLVMVRKLKRERNEVILPVQVNDVIARQKRAERIALLKQAKEFTVSKQAKEVAVPKQAKEITAAKLIRNITLPNQVKEVTIPKQVKEVTIPKQVKEVTVPKHSPEHSEEFICKTCGKQFVNQYYLSLHQAREKSHQTLPKTETLTCKLCLKNFNSLTDVLDHIVQLHKNIGECFDIQDYIIKPDAEEDTSNHVCLHCKKTFSNLLIFKSHLKKHTVNHECVACNMSFKNKFELLAHRKEHLTKFMQTSELKSEVEEKIEAPPSKKSDDRLRCDRCPVSFPVTALEEWTRHGETHVKKFRCEVCGKMFVLQSELEYHKSQHGPLDYKMFKCTMCSKQFNTLTELQIHGEIHRNQCSICKIFFTSYEHQRSHTHKLVGTYKCDLCVISFSTPLAVKQHKRLAHNNDYLIGKSK